MNEPIVPTEAVDVQIIPNVGANDAALSDLEIMDRALAAKEAEAATDDVDDDSTADESVDDAVAAAKAKDAEESEEEAVEEPAEAEAEAEKASKDAAEEAKADENKAKDEPTEDEEFSPSLSVHALQTRIAKTPELKALVEKDPKFRNALFHTARQADKAAKYDDIFQTPALASEAAKAAEGFYELRNLYEGEDSIKFLQRLVFDSFEKDEAGNVKLDELSRPVSNGAYERHMGKYREVWFNDVVARAKSFADGTVFFDDISKEDILEAVRIVQAVTEGKPGAGAPANKAPVSKEIQDQLDELARIKAERATASTQSAAEFDKNVDVATKDAIETDLKNLLAKRLPKDSALTDYFKDKIISDAAQSILSLAEKNKAHQNVLKIAKKNSTRDAAGVTKITNIQKAFAKELYGRELTRVLTQATPGVVTTATAARERIANQKNRPEVKANGGVGSPSLPASPLATAKAIEADFKAKGKRPSAVSEEEFLNEALSRVG